MSDAACAPNVLDKYVYRYARAKMCFFGSPHLLLCYEEIKATKVKTTITEKVKVLYAPVAFISGYTIYV